jgi:hypothetical protein
VVANFFYVFTVTDLYFCIFAVIVFLNVQCHILFMNISFAMFKFFLSGLLLLFCTGRPVADNDDKPSRYELDEIYIKKWSCGELVKANTAGAVDYLSNEEKEVFFYLNLARINPPLFARTYATGYNGDRGWNKGYAFDLRKESLIKELSEMNPLPALEPDDELYAAAKCFAYESGRLGLTGHDRSKTGCRSIADAECCDYGGEENGLSIVMSLLIDAGKNNVNLGHRRILLDEKLTCMGVSVQIHNKFKTNAVLDFKRRDISFSSE